MAITAEDWDKARGVDCSECGREAFQIRDGLCPRCYNSREAEREIAEGKVRERRHAVRLFNQGRISLAQLRSGQY